MESQHERSLRAKFFGARTALSVAGIGIVSTRRSAIAHLRAALSADDGRRPGFGSTHRPGFAHEKTQVMNKS